MKAANRTRTMRTSEEAVRSATGHSREEWFSLLDSWDAAAHKHRDIAAWIMREHGVNNWWAQTLTVGYEQARGLRKPGGSRNGPFAVTASTTVAVSPKRLFEAFTDVKLRERWLPGAVMRERTSKPGRSARFDWQGGATRVNVGFTAKGKTTQVALQHQHLPDAKTAENMKEFWRQRLAALKALMTG
jgi:uncharacterized protein YndB with AHSA1/START domain